MGKNPKRPGGTPPKEHQFKPGKSGNPGGRPTRKPTMRDAVHTALERLVEATIDGKRQSIPLKDALANAFLASIGSDPELFVKAMRWLEGETPPRVSPDGESESDAAEDPGIYEGTIERELRRRRSAEDDNDV